MICFGGNEPNNELEDMHPNTNSGHQLHHDCLRDHVQLNPNRRVDCFYCGKPSSFYQTMITSIPRPAPLRLNQNEVADIFAAFDEAAGIGHELREGEDQIQERFIRIIDQLPRERWRFEFAPRERLNIRSRIAECIRKIIPPIIILSSMILAYSFGANSQTT